MKTSAANAMDEIAMHVRAERERCLKIIERHFDEQATKGMLGARAQEVLTKITKEIIETALANERGNERR